MPQECRAATPQLSVSFATLTTVPSGQFGGYAANSSFIIHHSSLACGPVDAGSCFCEALFSTSRTILHAARNGHIFISRQRAPANSKHCQCVYREDAKGGAAKSVRDRFTAPLRSGRIKSHVSHVSYVSHNAPRPLVPYLSRAFNSQPLTERVRSDRKATPPLN